MLSIVINECTYTLLKGTLYEKLFISAYTNTHTHTHTQIHLPRVQKTTEKQVATAKGGNNCNVWEYKKSYYCTRWRLFWLLLFVLMVHILTAVCRPAIYAFRPNPSLIYRQWFIDEWPDYRSLFPRWLTWPITRPIRITIETIWSCLSVLHPKHLNKTITPKHPTVWY